MSSLDRLKTSKTILFCAQDPGGANQMVAVREQLLRHIDGSTASQDLVDQISSITGIDAGDELTLVAGGRTHGLVVFAKAGIDAIEFAGAEENLLDETGADVLVTEAPSSREPGFHGLWRAANRRGVPCIVFLDHEVNVVERFVENGEAGLLIPDHIFVLSDASRQKLVSAGVAAERITVHSNLYLQRLQTRASNGQSRTELRNAWCTGHGDLVVLFASECASEMEALGYPRSMNEHAVVNRLIDMIAGNRLGTEVETNGENTVLVIRPHPRDKNGKYQRFLGDTRCRVLINTDGDSLAAIDAADVVAGVSSMMLEEAETLGKPVVRIEGFPA